MKNIWYFLIIFIIKTVALPVKLDAIEDIKALPTFPLQLRVVETFLVTSLGHLIVEFQDSFCSGSSFRIYDNNVLVTTVISLLPRYCGINTSSYTPIISPTFASYTYELNGGSHNLTLEVIDSPIRTASVRVTFFPTDNTKLNVVSNGSYFIQSI